jgi:hypothetical protein
MDTPARIERPEMEGTITCPSCGQMLAATCRICVSCKQAIDPDALHLSQPRPLAVGIPGAEPAAPLARFSWPIFFLTLAVSWVVCALAAIFLGAVAAQLLFAGVTIGSSLWVVWDAQTNRFLKPWRWGAACLLLWIAFFPWYVSRRRMPEARCPFVEGERSVLPRVLVALLLLQLLLAALIRMKQGPAVLP